MHQHIIPGLYLYQAGPGLHSVSVKIHQGCPSADGQHPSGHCHTHIFLPSLVFRRRLNGRCRLCLSRLYLSRRAFEPHHNAADAFIGLDERLKGSPRLVFVDNRLEIAPGMTLVNAGQVPLYGGLDTFGLKVLRQGRLQADDFLHEQYLLIEEGGRRVLFSGCSHRGILNIARRFRPDVLIGGFHLFKLPVGAALDGFADALEALGATYYTCHCTGAEQYEYMKRRMTRLNYISAGDTVEV